jgi:hypothetical protein
LSFSSGLGLCRAVVQLRVGTSLQNPCNAQCMQAIHVCNIPLRLGAVSSLCCDGHHAASCFYMFLPSNLKGPTSASSKVWSAPVIDLPG